MPRADLEAELEWLDEHFFQIRHDIDAPSIDTILEAARAAVLRHGIKGLAIDPFNEVEHARDRAESETEYISRVLGMIKRFAQAHGVHVWLIAHPTKIQRNQDGTLPVPKLYDISGSAHWANKTDNGVTVYREDPTGTATQIHITKVRFQRIVGTPGMVSMTYDKWSGRYSERLDMSRIGAV